MGRPYNLVISHFTGRYTLKSVCQSVRPVLGVINYNYVFYGIAAIAVLYTLTSPPIADPLVNFFFGGIVPGTDIIIGPEAILVGEALIAGLGLGGTLGYRLGKRTHA